MGRYGEEIEFLKRVEKKKSRRTTVSTKKLQRLAKEYRGIPQDYLDYLAEVGFGSFREGQYAVYEGLTDAGFFFGDDVSRFPKGILCFGDDFSGNPGAFLPSKKWAVVELIHDNLSLYYTKQTFHEFIREQMLMGPEGEDLRSR